MEPDDELLQLQKRKSTPKVVIQEFMDMSSDEDDLIDSPARNEKTHIEIDDVSKSSIIFLPDIRKNHFLNSISFGLKLIEFYI